MQELKKEVIESLNKVNQAWVEAVKKAEKENDGLDLTEINGKYSKVMSELMIKFDEFAVRNKKNSKLF